MGSSPRLPASPAFAAAFRAAAGGTGRLRFDRFMDLALYGDEVGYYRRAGPRVGYGAGSDFYTATTSNPVFGELVVAAAVTLLREHGADPGAYTFVEIGAEPGAGVLRDVPHRFGAAQELRIGQPLQLSGRCVVFSNELFDAQPCRRLVRRNGGWIELHVTLGPDNALAFAELPLSPDAHPLPLPDDAAEGYHLDLPLAAAALTRTLAAQPWQGLFLAFDYGKSWPELSAATPQGTTRAYHRHRQSTDLLDHPGEQDLTAHVCWDWLADALTAAGFDVRPLRSQEAFFVHHAGDALAAMMAAESAGLGQRKLALMQLIHPEHLGQKFQALAAWRKQ